MNKPQRRTRSMCADSRLTPAEYFIVVLVLFTIVAAALFSSRPIEVDLVTQRVRVSEGDSLWALAEQYPVPGMSTRETVQLLAELNGLESPRLAAGDSIAVPAARVSEPNMVAMR